MLPVKIMAGVFIQIIAVVAFSIQAKAFNKCTPIFKYVGPNADQQQVISDYMNIENPRHSTFIHQWTPDGPKKRLVDDSVLNSGFQTRSLPVAIDGNPGVVHMFASLGRNLYLSLIGIGVVETKMFGEGSRISKGERNHKWKTLQRMERVLRSDIAFPPNHPHFRVGALDGRIQMPGFELWVAEHNAGVNLSQLKQLTIDSRDPRHISKEEYEVAEGLYRQFRRELIDVFHSTQQAMGLLNAFDMGVRDIPERAFIYHNGRWHLNLLQI